MYCTALARKISFANRGQVSEVVSQETKPISYYSTYRLLIKLCIFRLSKEHHKLSTPWIRQDHQGDSQHKELKGPRHSALNKSVYWHWRWGRQKALIHPPKKIPHLILVHLAYGARHLFPPDVCVMNRCIQFMYWSVWHIPSMVGWSPRVCNEATDAVLKQVVSWPSWQTV